MKKFLVQDYSDLFYKSNDIKKLRQLGMSIYANQKIYYILLFFGQYS